MSSYIGRHAELYDLFYADKPYQEESAFVDWCLQQYSLKKPRRLLELACGTGSHAIALAQLGYMLTATDYSEDMLACAQRKIEGNSASVQFLQQDMRSLEVPGAPFDAAICLFDSIGYVQTNEALGHVLRGIHQHLIEGGLFIFEFWHAAAMLRNYDPVRVRRWQTPEGEILRISEVALQDAQQLASVTFTIYELNRNGTYRSLIETQTNRYFLMQEMAHWLTSYQFEPVKWFAGFTPSEQIDNSTWHIVAVARRC